jgi:hypothetical protein
MITDMVSKYSSAPGAHTVLASSVSAYPRAFPAKVRRAIHITRSSGIGSDMYIITLAAQPAMTSIEFREGSYLVSIVVTSSTATNLSVVKGMATLIDGRVKSQG